jgi:hypothetical protein
LHQYVIPRGVRAVCSQSIRRSDTVHHEESIVPPLHYCRPTPVIAVHCGSSLKIRGQKCLPMMLPCCPSDYCLQLGLAPIVSTSQLVPRQMRRIACTMIHQPSLTVVRNNQRVLGAACPCGARWEHGVSPFGRPPRHPSPGADEIVPVIFSTMLQTFSRKATTRLGSSCRVRTMQPPCTADLNHHPSVSTSRGVHGPCSIRSASAAKQAQ